MNSINAIGSSLAAFVKAHLLYFYPLGVALSEKPYRVYPAAKYDIQRAAHSEAAYLSLSLPLTRIDGVEVEWILGLHAAKDRIDIEESVRRSDAPDPVFRRTRHLTDRNTIQRDILEAAAEVCGQLEHGQIEAVTWSPLRHGLQAELERLEKIWTKDARIDRSTPFERDAEAVHSFLSAVIDAKLLHFYCAERQLKGQPCRRAPQTEIHMYGSASDHSAALILSLSFERLDSCEVSWGIDVRAADDIKTEGSVCLWYDDPSEVVFSVTQTEVDAEAAAAAIRRVAEEVCAQTIYRQPVDLKQ